MYIADEDLRTGSGALAYAAGSEVPDNELNTAVAKAQDWKNKVSEGRTKTLRADGAGTDKPAKEAENASAPARPAGRSS